MGQLMSKEEQLKEFVKRFKQCPDVKVNRSIVMFCSTSSSETLQQHLNNRTQKEYPIADWMKQLAEKLANLCLKPELAGLGALAIAIFIDVISAASSSEATMEALRSVFAEEKASEVWDQIDECLKRCMMNINNRAELVSDIKRIECQLSAAVTKLKNSMVRDGHMSHQALKAWVNGAAFHIQMLIHLVRLGGIQTCDPVVGLLSAYLRDLDLLFEKHKEAVKKKCKLRELMLEEGLAPCFVSEEDEWDFISYYTPFSEYFEAYYEEHYNSQKNEIRKYFRKVRDDLPELVSQVGHLSVC
ncbi:uncharacterized protein LOC119895659 [Micropterus salmoides]|uniref:uncharacterized protein LOC119895659 n=1 Tax=Micropterus salmoides TaxID=27706 RepID=UPI0018EA482A|nr:uncharacterized protein LOC119895659 [Micropterus salmoides]